VGLTTHDAGVIGNFAATLQPALWLAETERLVVQGRNQGLSDQAFRERERVVEHTHARWNEVSRDQATCANDRIETAQRDGRLTETYRRISVDAALALLG
jgi:hypothetical protein